MAREVRLRERDNGCGTARARIDPTSAIDRRTCRHSGYRRSQSRRRRQRVEEVFGWLKTVAGQDPPSRPGASRLELYAGCDGLQPGTDPEPYGCRHLNGPRSGTLAILLTLTAPASRPIASCTKSHSIRTRHFSSSCSRADDVLDESEICLLDYIFGQQDCAGNIDYCWFAITSTSRGVEI